MWNARVKDELEEQLHEMVCDGQLDLSTAQSDIAKDWVGAYKKYFHTEKPLPAPALTRAQMQKDNETCDLQGWRRACFCCPVTSIWLYSLVRFIGDILLFSPSITVSAVVDLFAPTFFGQNPHICARVSTEMRENRDNEGSKRSQFPLPPQAVGDQSVVPEILRKKSSWRTNS